MKGFKTIIFGVLIMATAVFSNEETATFVSEHLPSVGGSIGLILIVLRAVTSSSIFKDK